MATVALQRSKEWLEDKGWHVCITEYWHAFAKVRRDLYGFGDLTAIRHDFKGVWAVNACDIGAMQKHVEKYLNGWLHPKRGPQPPNPHLPVWLSGGNRFSIFGWGLRSSDGRGSRKIYKLRVLEAYLDGAEPKFKEIVEIPAP